MRSLMEMMLLPMKKLRWHSSFLLTEDTSSSKHRRKPPPTRVIIEVNPVAAMLEKYLKCPRCDLLVTFQQLNLLVAFVD
jgi:hypothetical protein